jgi:hypothetical protein
MNLVQTYYQRLSQHGAQDDLEALASSKGRRKAKRYFHRLNYYEISRIASYLDHNDVETFRSLSRVCNYGACFGIMSNLQSFKLALNSDQYLKA